MDRKLRLILLGLALGYWAALWLVVSGWGMTVPFLPLIYPMYRCGRRFRAGRIWYLGALVSIILACIPLPMVNLLGVFSFHQFFSAANLHLAVRVRNIQASLLLALGFLAAPLATTVGGLAVVAGILAEGFGLALLLLSAPGARVNYKSRQAPKTPALA